MKGSYLGPSFSDKEIEDKLNLLNANLKALRKGFTYNSSKGIK